MRALEASDLWREILLETSHDNPVSESKVIKFRTIFFTDRIKRDITDKHEVLVNIDYNKEVFKNRMDEVGLSKIKISFILGMSDYYLNNALTRKRLKRKHIKMINDLLGGEYIKVVED